MSSPETTRAAPSVGKEGAWRALALAETACAVLAGVVVVATMVLVSVDAVGRYFFNSPITFQYELTKSYLMPMVLLMPLSWAYRQGAFIRIDAIDHLVPAWLTSTINIAALSLAAAVFALIAGYSAVNVYDAWVQEDVLIGIIDWPVYLARVWVPLSCALLTVRLLVDVWYLIAEFGHREDAAC